MLYRAAQLTVNSGYDWFETNDWHTQGQTDVIGTSWGPGFGGYWSPYWRAYGPGGWGGWGGWGGGGMGGLGMGGLGIELGMGGLGMGGLREWAAWEWAAWEWAAWEWAAGTKPPSPVMRPGAKS